jgi:hypothetical protein
MLHRIRFLVPVLALGLVAALSYGVRAEDAPKADQATGTINGKVVDKDNKPVAGATIRLVAAPQKAHRGKRDLAAGDKPADNAKPRRRAAVAEATSDQDGKFTLANVPAGDYRLMAALKKVGVGTVQVQVQAGETKDVTVTIEPRQPRHPKPAT